MAFGEQSEGDDEQDQHEKADDNHGCRDRDCGLASRQSTVHYGSASEAVTTEIEATPLAQRIGQDTRRRLVEAASVAMESFEVDGGRVELPIRGHLITGAKAG